MQPTRISVSGLTSVSRTSVGKSIQLKNWVAEKNESTRATEYTALNDCAFMFTTKDGKYYPDYAHRTTDWTHDMEFDASTDSGADPQISGKGHTPLSPFFSRHLRYKVIDKAESEGVTVFPGQCRLESIHFPHDHTPLSPPTSTANESRDNEAPETSQHHEPRESIITFVVEDPKNLITYPPYNFFTEVHDYFDRQLNHDPM